MKDQDQKKPGHSPDKKHSATPEKGGQPKHGDAARGGHAGYSAEEEQQQVNRENEQMHNERDEQDLDTSKEQRTGVDKNEGSDPRKSSGL